MTLLEDIARQLEGLPPEKVEELKQMVSGQKFYPTPGPQMNAFHSRADVTLYGGSGGGGKSALILGLALTSHKRSLIMRRKYGDLSALTDELIKFHGTRNGYSEASGKPRLRTDDGRLVEFGACQHLGDEESWQGQAHDLLCVARGTKVHMGDDTLKPVESLLVGDYVQTLEGPRRVNKAFPVHKKAVVRLEVKDEVGRLVATQIQSSNHKVLTSAGWVSHDTCGEAHPCGISSPMESDVGHKRVSQTSCLPSPVSGPLPDTHAGCLAHTPSELPQLLGCGYSTASCEAGVLPRQESCSAEYCGYSPAILPPQIFPSQAVVEGSFSSAPCESTYYCVSDTPCEPKTSAPQDSQGHCSACSRPCGEHTLATSGHSHVPAAVPTGLQQLLYAVRPSPNDSPDGGEARTHEYNPRRTSYPHPYRTETRYSAYSLRNLACETVVCDPLGIDLFDVEIDEVNHFITEGGIINKNCFDEVTQFHESQVRFLMGWNRPSGDSPDQRCRVIMASNPPTTAAGQWIIDYFAPWIDPSNPNPAKPGELRWFVADAQGKDKEVDGPQPVWDEEQNKMLKPMSRTFIAAKLADNPFLANTNYAANLDSLPEPLRSAIRDGNFMASRQDTDLQVIPSDWVRQAQTRWLEHEQKHGPGAPKEAPMCAMGVDPAKGGRDETTIAPRYDGWYAPLIVTPGVETPEGKDTAALVLMARRNKAVVVIDVGGGYGDAAYEILKANFENPFASPAVSKPVVKFDGASASVQRTVGKTMPFFNKRAEAWWRFREALDPSQEGGSVIMLPNDAKLLADLTAPELDNNVLALGKIKIEGKPELKKRLGRSPDRGDAVVMAWSEGNRAMTHAATWKGYRDDHSGGGHRPKVVGGYNDRRRPRG